MVIRHLQKTLENDGGWNAMTEQFVKSSSDVEKSFGTLLTDDHRRRVAQINLIITRED